MVTSPAIVPMERTWYLPSMSFLSVAGNFNRELLRTAGAASQARSIALLLRSPFVCSGTSAAAGGSASEARTAARPQWNVLGAGSLQGSTPDGKRLAQQKALCAPVDPEPGTLRSFSGRAGDRSQAQPVLRRRIRRRFLRAGNYGA